MHLAAHPVVHRGGLRDQAARRLADRARRPTPQFVFIDGFDRAQVEDVDQTFDEGRQMPLREPFLQRGREDQYLTRTAGHTPGRCIGRRPDRPIESRPCMLGLVPKDGKGRDQGSPAGLLGRLRQPARKRAGDRRRRV